MTEEHDGECENSSECDVEARHERNSDGVQGVRPLSMCDDISMVSSTRTVLSKKVHERVVS